MRLFDGADSFQDQVNCSPGSTLSLALYRLQLQRLLYPQETGVGGVLWPSSEALKLIILPRTYIANIALEQLSWSFIDGVSLISHVVVVVIICWKQEIGFVNTLMIKRFSSPFGRDQEQFELLWKSDKKVELKDSHLPRLVVALL